MSRQGYKDGRVDKYRALKTIRYFGGGRQSSKVGLLEGSKVVAKHFDSKNAKHVKAYDQELRNLSRVKGCKFVSKLLAADPQRLVIYTKYAGERPAAYTPELVQEVKQKIDVLKTKYKLTRKFHPTLGGMPRLANVAIKKGHVKLIDLGPPFHSC